MSASNWDRCPRCLKQAEDVIDNLQRQVDEAYGHVPIDKFDQMRESLAEQRRLLTQSFQTFREDYRIYGAEEGVVKVRYSGSCSVCKLNLEFACAHPIEGL